MAPQSLKKVDLASSLIINGRWHCRSYFQISLPWFLAIPVQSFTVIVFTFVEFGAALSGVHDFFFFYFCHVEDGQVAKFCVESSQTWFIFLIIFVMCASITHRFSLLRQCSEPSKVAFVAAEWPQNTVPPRTPPWAVLRGGQVSKCCHESGRKCVIFSIFYRVENQFILATWTELRVNQGCVRGGIVIRRHPAATYATLVGSEWRPSHQNEYVFHTVWTKKLRIFGHFRGNILALGRPRGPHTVAYVAAL